MSSVRPPRATYRVQLHAGFTLQHAAGIVPYLADLGVSHLYTSPIFQAGRNSTHGYDVIDPTSVSVDLGGEAALVELVDALREHGMGLVVDLVPNHMAATGENPWWWDVLAHGRASRYADVFDIDWDSARGPLGGRVLLPVLQAPYRRELTSGAIQLRRSEATIVVEYARRRYPVDPRTSAPLVIAAAREAGSEALAEVGAGLAGLPATATDAAERERRHHDAEQLQGHLGDLVTGSAIAAALDGELERLSRDLRRLDALLRSQHYRLAHWRVASRRVGYRRFFDVDALVGVRVELEPVFTATHLRITDLVADGSVQGVRIDHPDGLRDPGAYFDRLRAAMPETWIVAEKIVGADEGLPESWPIDGTTGYRFANLATGLLVDPAGEGAFSDLWAGVAGDAVEAWEPTVAAAREQVLAGSLGGDVRRLVELFAAVCAAVPRAYRLTELRDALVEVAAAMPVYRTYVQSPAAGASAVDAARIRTAVGTASGRRPDLAELLELLGAVLRMERSEAPALELAARFQQLTPAAMAKGVEDTAFYRFGRLLALNEVGGDPGRFGVTPDDFHAAMRRESARSPGGMLALSTHDTKRSGDVRARLAVLSEDPAAWAAALARLREGTERHRSDRARPTDADVYVCLQTLVGAWPIGPERLRATMLKSAREAKLRTSWARPDAAYEERLVRFVDDLLADPGFVAELEATVEPLVEPGRRAALSQVALQLTAPGVPDIYQGSELWDLSLVDPDNRRPVDYGRRRRALDEVRSMTAREAWIAADDGRAKLWLVRHALDLRRRLPETFAGGAYLPIGAAGPMAAAVIAFARGGDVCVLAPRLVRRVATRGWGSTEIELPDGRWRNLDGRDHGGRAMVEALLSDFPVAILERRP